MHASENYYYSQRKKQPPENIAPGIYDNIVFVISVKILTFKLSQVMNRIFDYYYCG